MATTTKLAAVAATTTTTTNATTPEVTEYEIALAWQLRSMEQARARGLAESAQRLGVSSVRRPMMELWAVPSASGRYGRHIVRWHLDSMQLECDCPAARLAHRACAHCGAVLLAWARMEREERLRQVAERQHSEAWDWWMNGGEWD